MQLTQKNPQKKSKFKLLAYSILACLLISCKPFAYRQGFGFVFDYEVALNRIQHTINWLSYRLSTHETQVVLKRGDK